ncbi:MAG: plasmid pRiA4b ORF-3 family protein [Firmicutes bacterium]|nr:plasmid pRiA4b ORF-3 family protein [Bacillota bacterium]
MPAAGTACPARSTYEYDFGDSWIHELVLEEIATANRFSPVYLDGKGERPRRMSAVKADIRNICGSWPTAPILNTKR